MGGSVAEEDEGAWAYWLKDREPVFKLLAYIMSWDEDQGTNEPDLCNAISKVGSANMGWCKGYDSVILSP